MARTICIISGAAMPHNRCVLAPLAGSLNGAPARSRCIGMDHATFEVEEADEYRVGQTAFVRLNGFGMVGTVDRVDHHDGIVNVAWKRDSGTRGKVEQVLRPVIYGRFNGVRMVAYGGTPSRRVNAVFQAGRKMRVEVSMPPPSPWPVSAVRICSIKAADAGRVGVRRGSGDIARGGAGMAALGQTGPRRRAPPSAGEI